MYSEFRHPEDSDLTTFVLTDTIPQSSFYPETEIVEKFCVQSVILSFSCLTVERVCAARTFAFSPLA